MKTPLVSVITTVYNCEKFIEQSLRSIFDQTFRDFEFIIYNDASTDNTWQIINSIMKDFDGNYNIINNTTGQNIGCAAGRNLAIKQASGKYVAIQDGDDISKEHRLEKEVEFIEANPDLFCVGTWATVIDANGKYIKDFDYPPAEHNDVVKDIFRMQNPIIDPSSLFKRDVFDILGCYEPEWYLVPDLHLWVKAMLGNYRFANILEKMVSHRKHLGSVMGGNALSAMLQHRLLYKLMVKKYKKEVFFI